MSHANPNNDYRIDILAKISDHKLKCGASYHIPCGMNSIIFLSSHSPKRSDLLHATSKIDSDHVAVVSYYDYKDRDYKVSSIIDSPYSY